MILSASELGATARQRGQESLGARDRWVALGLSNRCANVITRAGIVEPDQLRHLSKRELSQIRGLGALGLAEIAALLSRTIPPALPADRPRPRQTEPARPVDQSFIKATDMSPDRQSRARLGKPIAGARLPERQREDDGMHARGVSARFDRSGSQEAIRSTPRETAEAFIARHGHRALKAILRQETERSIAGDLAGAAHFEQAYDEAVDLLMPEARTGWYRR